MNQHTKSAVITGCVAVAVLLAFGASQTWAGPTVHVDYSQMSVGYTASNSGSGVFSVTDTSASAALAQTFDPLTPGVTLDRADIFNGVPGRGSFHMNFGGTLNSGGTDHLSFNGAAFRATDALTTMAAPSLLADFHNTSFGNDADGIIFSNGVLTIHGMLSTPVGNDSILLNPAGGDWTYTGRADAGIAGGGADGVANQITIGSGRSNYGSGVLALLEISLRAYADGTLITATNADELFAQAALHGGFLAADGDLKVDVVPAPGAVLLGAIGLGLLGLAKRRLA